MRIKRRNKYIYYSFIYSFVFMKNIYICYLFISNKIIEILEAKGKMNFGLELMIWQLVYKFLILWLNN